MPPADPDDFRSRFDALMAQIDDEQAARMRAEAGRLDRHARGGRRRWIGVWLVVAVVAGAGALVAIRPGLLPLPEGPGEKHPAQELPAQELPAQGLGARGEGGVAG